MNKSWVENGIKSVSLLGSHSVSQQRGIAVDTIFYTLIIIILIFSYGYSLHDDHNEVVKKKKKWDIRNRNHIRLTL